MFLPCDEWAEKLAATHPDDLSLAEQYALNMHIASCVACAAVQAEYQAMRAFIHDVPAPDSPSGFPLRLLQLQVSQEGYDSSCGSSLLEEVNVARGYVGGVSPVEIRSQFEPVDVDKPDVLPSVLCIIAELKYKVGQLSSGFWKAATTIYLTILTLKEIVSWFAARVRLIDRKYSIAFTLQEGIKSGRYRTIQGVFNINQHAVIEGRVIESKKIEEEFAHIHREQSVVFYS